MAFDLAQFLINNDPVSREDLSFWWAKHRAGVKGKNKEKVDSGHPSARPFVRQLSLALDLAVSEVERMWMYEQIPSQDIYEILLERLAGWRAGLPAGRKAKE